MDFALRLGPERTGWHPHLGGIGVVVVYPSANDDAAVGHVVDVGWRFEAVGWLEQESSWLVAIAVAPEGTCLRGEIAALRIEVSPIDLGCLDCFYFLSL